MFGWQKISEFDMGKMGIYPTFGRGEKMFGGMWTKPKDDPMPVSWL